MNTVTINNKQLPAVEYRGQRVVTLAMIDEVHQRPEGTARAAFNRNRSHFIEGVDFLEMTADVIRTESLSDAFAARTAKGIILFESGYLMLTKPFNDDLAWQVQRELVNSYFRTRAPMTEIEMIAAMAADAVRQQKRLNHVEEQIETVTEAVENIKRGTMRAGYVGYRQVVAKSGMTDAKCRNLVNAYRIPTDTHEFMTPDGLLSRRAIVEFEPFMKAFRQMMSEAEPRGTRWYHPKMGLFQAIGWEGKA
ncbi:ORF6N domain-containing protein [Citrobacter freundii]|uniref:ORF6N domain-containing protein n=1 Tax=Citrobacter freundii TaxID=546 RepID=A0AAP5XYK9_CITFR|nr:MULTISPECIES: ORF6N domain-containing protein [Enterobacteriaceae]HCJ6199847.1 ORF6N domain-containing protein [Enterobacter hormaechei subsp. xiangfangensis]HEM8765763.1 ORF6N domain-containing protein [Enterobacter roggenkampii]ELE6461899.1 ORF6N domain-containing protein [Enterobacter hormaechei]MBW7696173.1 ORF6N domain-containing protein [Enterobacter kobei]MBW7772517.1 ORF6N domain-containing protein [Enterobacter kobei]